METGIVIKHPLSTEKSIRLMESDNKLLFEVATDATKRDIRQAIEKMFKVKVMSVATFVGPDGKKRAYIRFSKETPAIDIATKLGLI